MVRDGVVSGVVHVYGRGAAVHLLDDEGGAYGPECDIGDCSFDGVVQVAVHARLDGPAALALRLVQLLDHLADHQHEQADVVDRGYVEPARAAIVAGRLTIGNRGHGQIAAWSVTCDEISDARTVMGKQARAIADSANDLGGVLRVVGHHQPGARLLVPAKTGYAVVSTVQDARLTCRGRRR
jgi:hypothetical protein